MVREYSDLEDAPRDFLDELDQREDSGVKSSRIFYESCLNTLRDLNAKKDRASYYWNIDYFKRLLARTLHNYPELADKVLYLAKDVVRKDDRNNENDLERIVKKAVSLSLSQKNRSQTSYGSEEFFVSDTDDKNWRQSVQDFLAQNKNQDSLASQELLESVWPILTSNGKVDLTKSMLDVLKNSEDISSFVPDLSTSSLIRLLPSHPNLTEKAFAEAKGENDYYFNNLKSLSACLDVLKENPNLAETLRPFMLLALDEQKCQAVLDNVDELPKIKNMRVLPRYIFQLENMDQAFQDALSYDKRLHFAREAFKASAEMPVFKASAEMPEGEEDDRSVEQVISRDIISDMAYAGIDSVAQGEKVIKLFCELGERPDRYASPYNIPVSFLAPAVKMGAEDWMVKPMYEAWKNGLFNVDRMGSRVEMFDACKAWTISPKIWKKEAVKIGKMPLEARIVAGAIINKAYKECKGINGEETDDVWGRNKQYREDFWKEFKTAQDMGWRKAIEKYTYDNPKTRARIISACHPEITDERTMLLMSHFLEKSYLLQEDRKLDGAAKFLNSVYDDWGRKEWLKTYGFRDNDVYRSFEKEIFHKLTRLAETSPEHRGEIFGIAFSTKLEDKDKFRMAAACLKQMKPEEARAQYPDQAELIDAAYKARFCDEKEKDFLLDHYSFKDIGQMNLSAQQRCKNILVGMLAQENKLKPAKNWRTDKASVKLYQNNQDWIIPASFKAEQIFGCYFPSYMKQTVPYFGVHDSVSWLPADLTPENAETFRSFIGNNIIYATQDGEKHARPMKELMIISKNWNSLKPEEQKGKYKDVLSVCMSRKYKDQTCGAFAAEAAKHGVPEYKYKNCEDIYLSGLGVPEPFDSSKTYQFGKYTGRFVTRDDVRTGFFGDYTNCCQHFDGVGNACAVSTVKDPYSQLFVIEDDKGRIIAGSWAWENKEGKYRDVCFDNIEAIGEDSRTEMLNRIYEMAAKDLCETQNCRKVTIGLGYQDADTSKYQQTEAIALPEQYHNKYSDARSQVLLRENPKAQPLDKTQESKRFIRAASFLDVDEMEKVSEKCFPDSDRALQTPDHVEGLVLVDEAKGIVGYCLYDSKEKDIYDMAVLPEYRKDKNGSSLKLLGETIKKVKEFGGEWSADLRDKTTLQFMEAMEKRGLVEMERKGVDHTMSDESEVVTVSFRPVVPEQTKTKAPQQRPVGRGGR